jgi:hypothetical protein
VSGGEGTMRVFGNNESWSPERDAWEVHAPMRTPRHGMGAAAIGEWIYVAGGGPVQAVDSSRPITRPSR